MVISAKIEENSYKKAASKISGNKSLTELAFIIFPVSPIK